MDLEDFKMKTGKKPHQWSFLFFCPEHQEEEPPYPRPSPYPSPSDGEALQSLTILDPVLESVQMPPPHNKTKKQLQWKRAVKIAEWVHIDEMRTLLELHYDAVHFQRWKDKHGKAPNRRSEFHVFTGTINAHRKRLCQRLQLPEQVKGILKKPRDEDDLDRLEQLRVVVLKEMEGWERVLLESHTHVEAIARSVEEGKHNTLVDELGLDCQSIPACSRVVLQEQFADKASVVAALRQMQPNGTVDF